MALFNVAVLDNTQLNFPQGGDLAVNIVLGVIMFGVALEIKISDFKTLFYNPKPLIVGLVSQLIVVPLFTLTFAMIGYNIFGHNIIPPSVAMGMILVAACPGGNMANFMSALSKANVALSVSLTSVNTVLAIITTPFSFKLFSWLYLQFVDFMSTRPDANIITVSQQNLEINTIDMFRVLSFVLLIPLILGMACAYYLPKIKEMIHKPLQIISLLAFFAILVIALAKNLPIFWNNILGLFIIVLIHNAAAIFIGYNFARLFKLDCKNRQTMSIESSIHNSGLGLAFLLNKRIFPAGVPGGMLAVTAWWGVWHIIAGLFIAFVYRYKANKKAKYVIDQSALEAK